MKALFLKYVNYIPNLTLLFKVTALEGEIVLKDIFHFLCHLLTQTTAEHSP